MFVAEGMGKLGCKFFLGLFSSVLDEGSNEEPCHSLSPAKLKLEYNKPHETKQKKTKTKNENTKSQAENSSDSSNIVFSV